MKILVVDVVEEVRSVIGMHLELEFNLQVVYANSGNEAIRLLESRSDIACVISEGEMPDGTGADVFRYLLSRSSPIPFVLCSTARPDEQAVFREQPPDAYVAKPAIFDSLTQVMTTFIENGEIQAAKRRPDEFCRVSLKNLLKFGMFSCDLFSKLSDEKYVRIFSVDDVFELNDYDRFAAKNIEYLYLKVEDGKKFLDKFSASVLKLAGVKEVPIEPAYRASTEALAVISEFNQRLGFTPEVQALTTQTINLTLKNIRKSPKLTKLFETLILDSENYLASHSVALAHVACGISANMGWTSDTTFYKLTLAAFLHDLTLHNPELAKIQFFGGKDSSQGVDESTLLEIMSHPSESAALLDEIPGAPADVGLIIRQHHERPDGSGFPMQLVHTQINPLASVFIISHDLISFYLNGSSGQTIGAKPASVSKPAPDIMQFVNEFSSYYTQGNFKKIIKTIADSLRLPS